MFTWLSRIMVVVFVFNILAPQAAFAQKAPAKGDIRARVEEQADASRNKALSQAINQEELDNLYNARKNDLLNLYDEIDIWKGDVIANFWASTKVITAWHALEQEYAQKQHALPKDTQLQLSSLAVARQEIDPLVPAQAKFDVIEMHMNKLVSEMSGEDITPLDFLEKIDPANPQDINALDQAFGAEVLSNALQQMIISGNTDPEEIKNWLEWLPRVQARVFYALNKVPKELGTIMANGSMRMLMVWAHKFYEKQCRPDPFAMAMSSTVNASEQPFMGTLSRQNEGGVTAPQETQQWLRNQQISASGQGTRAMYKFYMGQFIQEMKALYNNGELKEMSADYADLMQLAGYAVQFAIFSEQPEAIEQMIAMFDVERKARKENWYAFKSIFNEPGVANEYQKEQYQHPFLDIIGTIMNMTASITKGYYPVLSNTTLEKIKAMLVDLSKVGNPLSTRVMAVMTAQAIHNTGEEKTVKTAQGIPSRKLIHEKKLEFDEKARQTLVGNAADIYYWASDRNEAFGLDYQQIQELKESLAKAINDLLPLMEPKAVFSGEGKEGWKPSKEMEVLNDIPSISEAVMGASGKSYVKPAFIKALDGRIASVTLSSHYNPHYANWKEAQIYLKIVFVEAPLWIYGGELLNATFRQLRAMGSAARMIPTGIKLAKAGEKFKFSRVLTEMRDGYKFANTSSIFGSRGASVASVTRAENVKVSAANVEALEKLVPGAAEAERVEVQVTRAGSSYFGPTTNVPSGTRGFWGKMGDVVTGKTPQVTEITILQNGKVFTIDAVKLGVTKGFNSVLSRKKIFEEFVRLGGDSRLLWKQAVGEATSWTLSLPTRAGMAGKAAKATGDGWAFWNRTVGQAWKRLRFKGAESLERAAWRSLFGQKSADGIVRTWWNAGKAETRFADVVKFSKEAAGGAKAESVYATMNGAKNYSFGFLENGVWRETSFEEFVAMYGNAAQKTTQTTGEAEIVAAFRKLGIPRNATAAQASKAYHEIVKVTHSDKFATLSQAAQRAKDQAMAEINAAYDVVKKAIGSGAGETVDAAVARALNVDALWMGKKGAKLGDLKQGFRVQTGMPLERQLLQHKNLIPFKDRLVTDWRFGSWVGGAILFGSWDLADRGMHKLQKPMVESTVEKQLKKEQEQYGDVFKQEGPASPSDVDTRIVQARSKYLDHQGALFSTPVIAALVAGGKNFIPEVSKELLAIAADRIALNKSIEKYEEVKNDQVATKLIKQMEDNLAETLKSYQALAAQEGSGAYKQEIQGMIGAVRELQQQVQKITAQPNKTALEKWTQVASLSYEKHNQAELKFAQKAQHLVVEGLRQQFGEYSGHEGYAEGYELLMKALDTLDKKIDRLANSKQDTRVKAAQLNNLDIVKELMNDEDYKKGREQLDAAQEALWERWEILQMKAEEEAEEEEVDERSTYLDPAEDDDMNWDEILGPGQAPDANTQVY